MPTPPVKAKPGVFAPWPGSARSDDRPSGWWKVFAALLAVVALAVAARYTPTWVTKLGLDGKTLTDARKWAATAARAAIPAMAAAITLAAVSAAAAVVSGRRRAQFNRVNAALAAVVRASAADGTLRRVGRRVTGRPRRLLIRLPAHFAVEDTRERKVVEQAAARILGGHWAGDWNDRRLRKGRLVLHAHTAAPITDSDIESNTDKARMLMVARRIFGQTGRLNLAVTLDRDHRAESFTLVHPPHPGMSRSQFREGVVGALTQLLPGLWEVRTDLASDTMTGHRRPNLERTIPYTPELITDANRFTIPVAAVAGQLARAGWNLEGKTPHGIVTGETGGGKTYAFLNLAVELLRRGIPVFGIDPKKIELMSLEGWPGLERLATDPAAAVAIIDYLYDLMMWRYTLIRQRTIRRSDLWPVVVFLDELLILQDELNDYWAEVKVTQGIKGGKDHPALRKLIRMAALARSARIHLITGVQRPQATLFPEGARDNFRFRLSLGRLTQEGALQMWGDPNTGTDVPSDIPGRGTISTPNGPKEAQVFRLPELDLQTPDGELPTGDAQLRASLLRECEAATAARPENIYLEIGGYTSPAAHLRKLLPADAAPDVEDQPDNQDGSQAGDEPPVAVAEPLPAKPSRRRPAKPRSATIAIAAAAQGRAAATPSAGGSRSSPTPAVVAPEEVQQVPVEVEDEAAVPELITMSVRGLTVGDKIRIDDPAHPGVQVDALVEDVDDETEEGRVLLDYRTVDSGQSGQLDLNCDDELPMAA